MKGIQTVFTLCSCSNCIGKPKERRTRKGSFIATTSQEAALRHYEKLLSQKHSIWQDALRSVAFPRVRIVGVQIKEHDPRHLSVNKPVWSVTVTLQNVDDPSTQVTVSSLGDFPGRYVPYNSQHFWKNGKIQVDGRVCVRSVCQKLPLHEERVGDFPSRELKDQLVKADQDMLFPSGGVTPPANHGR